MKILLLWSQDKYVEKNGMTYEPELLGVFTDLLLLKQYAISVNNRLVEWDFDKDKYFRDRDVDWYYEESMTDPM